MKFSNIKARVVFTSFLCIALILSGCVKKDERQADERLTDDANIEFFNKAGWQACAGGAIGGALIGALACSNKNGKSKTLCITGAAVAGCGIGIGVNAYLEYQRGKYENAEERLNASLIDIRRDNAKLEALTGNAKAVISDDRATLAQLEKDIAQKQLNQTTAEVKMARIDANLGILNQSVEKLQAREKEWQEIQTAERKQAKNKDAKQSVAMLDQEIRKMRSQVSMLQDEVDSLYRQRSAIKVS